MSSYKKRPANEQNHRFELPESAGGLHPRGTAPAIGEGVIWTSMIALNRGIMFEETALRLFSACLMLLTPSI
jgi:hypothetical protein